MKNQKIVLIAVVSLFFFVTSGYAQFKTNFAGPEKSKIVNDVRPKVNLGLLGGFAIFNNGTGINLGLFTEIELDRFAIVPMADYWKIDKASNFEMAGLLRLKFKGVSMTPYVDGGIGVNFYENTDPNPETKPKKVTNAGLILGGGLEFSNVFEGTVVFIDGKYKIIINDEKNVSGYTLTGGVKIPL